MGNNIKRHGAKYQPEHDTKTALTGGQTLKNQTNKETIMSNTTPAAPTYLTNGQSSAVQILVGINLNKTSVAFKEEAKELLLGKALEPQKIGNFTRQAMFAKNTMIAEGLTVEAQIEANKIMKAYGLIS